MENTVNVQWTKTWTIWAGRTVVTVCGSALSEQEASFPLPAMDHLTLTGPRGTGASSTGRSVRNTILTPWPLLPSLPHCHSKIVASTILSEKSHAAVGANMSACLTDSILLPTLRTKHSIAIGAPRRVAMVRAKTKMLQRNEMRIPSTNPQTVHGIPVGNHYKSSLPSLDPTQVYHTWYITPALQLLGLRCILSPTVHAPLDSLLTRPSSKTNPLLLAVVFFCGLWRSRQAYGSSKV